MACPPSACKAGPIHSSCNLLISNVELEDASANNTSTQPKGSIRDGRPALEVLPNLAPRPSGLPTPSPEEPACAASSATITVKLPAQGTSEAPLFNSLESESYFSMQPEWPSSEDSSEGSAAPSLIEAPQPIIDLLELSASRSPGPNAHDSPSGQVLPLVYSRSSSSSSGLDDGPDEATQFLMDDPVLENFLMGHHLQPFPTVEQSSETSATLARSRDLTAVPPTSMTSGSRAEAL